jgi:hypothetical protein
MDIIKDIQEEAPISGRGCPIGGFQSGGRREVGIFIFPNAGSSVLMDEDGLSNSSSQQSRSEMSVVPYLDFRRRQDNVIDLAAFRSRGGRPGVRFGANAEDGLCAPAADPRVELAAIPGHDSMLMVGG